MSNKMVADFDETHLNNNNNNNDVVEDDDHEHDMIMPGFRFHPTEEELIEFYLRRKVEGKRFNVELITFLDLYRHDPWELPALAAIGEKEWFFYVPRDRKYRNGDRPNRVTTSGYWKATGADRMIRGENCRSIGLKKTLVFYSGKAPKGIRTSWIMNEYRLPHHETEKYQKAEISLCRVYKRPGIEDPRSFPTRTSSSLSKAALTPSSSSSSKTHPLNQRLADTKANVEPGEGSTTTTVNNNNNDNSGPSEPTNIRFQQLPIQQVHQNIHPQVPSIVESTMAEQGEGIFVPNSVEALHRLVSCQNHEPGRSNVNQQYFQVAHQLHQQQQQQQQQQHNAFGNVGMVQSQDAVSGNSIPNGFSENRLWEMWNHTLDGNREFGYQLK